MNTRIKSGALAVLIAVGTTLAGVSQGVAAADEPSVIDLQTERAIYRALLSDTDLAGSQIFVSCEDGIVTLYGSTDDAGVKSRAESLIKKIDGVTEVRNNITRG